MNIFVEEQIPYLAESLSGCGKVFTFSGRKLRTSELIEKGCKVLFVRSTTKVDGNLLEGTQVEFVGSATSGVDHIDSKYLKSKGIEFAYAPGSNANSVAEYVIFGILHWAFAFNKNLSNLKIGIIGFGNIGSLVGKYANYFGWQVFVNDPPLLEEINAGGGKPFPNFVTHCDLGELLEVSDVITNHVPLTFEGVYKTYNLLNDSNLAMINDGALFIHTSRGGVVDETALIQFAETKKIILIIDVWKNEPEINFDLLEKSFIATPHVAGYSFDGKIRGTQAMLRAFEKFAKIQPNYDLVESFLKEYSPLSKALFLNPEKVYEMLLNSRKIPEDTHNFRKILNLRQTESKHFFDEFRVNYPIRREVL
ncbi:MAG: 4-phosphoerythronate dehydrogenase, partial [Candidatus Kapaibacteriales bacterium]